MHSLVVRGGTVIDATGERVADLLIEDGVIAAIGTNLTGDDQLDAAGCMVAPGLVDLHSHLRQPGTEAAETIESGSRGAVLGGYTAVVAMPDTDPVVDCASVVRDVQRLADDALCDIAIAATVTVGRNGEQLSPIAELAALGVRLFTDGHRGIQDDLLMRRALEYAGGLGVTIAQHCESRSLSAGAHMHEGAVSSILGIAGMPAEAEEVMVMRDIALSRLTGARIHFQQVTTAGSVAMVGAAKAQGLRITAEVSPHHLTLTDQAVTSYDARYKVSPPLRPQSDVDQLRHAARSGVIDAIATDHSPHETHLKEQPFDEAPWGTLGLETALGVTLAAGIELRQALALLSWQPAAIAGLDDHRGALEPGRPAHLAVIDPTASWTVRGGDMASNCRNTAFEGHTLTGRVRHTLVRGEAVVIDGEAQR